MKSLRIIVTVIAAISILVFLTSLTLVVGTDGTHETAGQVCGYSLIVSFVSLVFYQPKEGSGKLA